MTAEFWFLQCPWWFHSPQSRNNSSRHFCALPGLIQARQEPARRPWPSRHTLTRLHDEFGGNDLQFVFAHGWLGVVVRGQGLIEGDFVIVQSQVFAALICLASLRSSSPSWVAMAWLWQVLRLLTSI